ncbi:MAG TPA: hypothetical protein HA254_05930 [Candidatus Diapherotrites archaeon]|uniref:Glycosyl transferase family 28 C-terminal domain-containing protein n=1 Tax=Candidatus Iainarchaeum sp. TaxID=3101447 RepID=A0A7J4J1A7_9ARCH|nr:hypothetical protein [Candidatus Diapherotrites archaeon]
MKILYYFCGEGLGHTTRTIAAGTQLAKYHDVTFASYGYAKEFLEKCGLEAFEVPSEIKLVGKAGALDIKDSILTTVKRSSPTSFLRHVSIIDKFRPELIISDSFYFPSLIAKTKHIPFWMVLNQTNVEKFFSEHEESVRWIGNAVKKLNNSALSGVDKLLIPDFAPPYTISSHNLVFTPKMIGKVEYIGPLVRKNKSEIKARGRKNSVFASIGGFGYRRQVLDKLTNIARQMPEYTFDLVAGPNAQSIQETKNVRAHAMVTDPLTMMAKSSIVICGGGHSTIMESVCLSKPVLSIPDLFHFEQESNASQIQAMGLGARLDYKTPEPIIEDLLRKYTKDRETRKRLNTMAGLAQKLDGRKHMLRLVDEMESVKVRA